jgi:aryl-alcohol dehydrogenase-like predicted oxidoreductase
VQYRLLGTTGYRVSAISFGAWAIGADWGSVDDDQSMRTLHRALDLGVNFFDTADVYGDGRSERLLARLRRERADPFHVATKAGRRLQPHVTGVHAREPLCVRRPQSQKPRLSTCSRRPRGSRGVDTECLDLLQLHCPPTDVYYRPEVFEALDGLAGAGKIRWYGVSVERVEEALKAVEYPGVRTVQIIFNVFRQRPAERFFQDAARRRIGILARVPRASGLLTGRMSAATSFAADDHRTYNRHGEQFDRGETFSGVDFETGLAAVEEIRALVPAGHSMAELALRWTLMFDAVSCAIPGAKTPEQVEANCRAADLPPLSPDTMRALERVYAERIKPLVHARW